MLTLVCEEEKGSAFALLTASAAPALSWRAVPHHPQPAGCAPWVASDPLESVLTQQRELLLLSDPGGGAIAPLCLGLLQLQLLRKVKALWKRAPLREQMCWQLPWSPQQDFHCHAA